MNETAGTTINVDLNKQGTSPNPRASLFEKSTTWGLPLIIETPEGQTCGLIKTKTQSRWIPLTQKIIDSWKNIE